MVLTTAPFGSGTTSLETCSKNRRRLLSPAPWRASKVRLVVLYRGRQGCLREGIIGLLSVRLQLYLNLSLAIPQ